MRPLAESRRQWNETLRSSSSLEALQRAVKLDGPASPCESGCRSVCWKVFLLFRRAPAADWPGLLRQARADYDVQCERYLEFVRHPQRLAELTVDPLADDPDSPWDTFRRDEAVRAEILQDVQRLPDIPFYHQPRVQALIVDVLFVYGKCHPEVGGYRQGMHELLAPIVYVLDQDAVRGGQGEAGQGGGDAGEASDQDGPMREMLDAHCVEQDAFALFCVVMDKAKGFYESSGGSSSSRGGSFSNTNTAANTNLDTGLGMDTLGVLGADELLGPPLAIARSGGAERSAIVEMSREVHEGLLMKVDPELALHLTASEILPQIFLIRWMRLLFGREFPFDQLLVLWDSLFAQDPTLDLVPLVCVAMLLRIRWSLLEADYAMALHLLLKYPPPLPPHGPHTFVDDAVYLRDHLDSSGGVSLVLKYTGRVPASTASPPLAASLALPPSASLPALTDTAAATAATARPSTPTAALAAGLGSLRQRTMKAAASAAARSPLGAIAVRHSHHSDPLPHHDDSVQRTQLVPGATAPTSAAFLSPALRPSPPPSPSPSPSLSPSRFVQSREGVEALFQGAAKGVLERGEKLGINQAVRDAVGEIRRNMLQSLQEARHHHAAAKGGADSSTPPRSVLADMAQRNKQLARMLDEAVASLRAAAAASEAGSQTLPSQQQQQQQQQHLVEAVSLAAAKVQFVAVHLADASLTLPPDDPTPRPTGSADSGEDDVAMEDGKQSGAVTAAAVEAEHPDHKAHEEIQTHGAADAHDADDRMAVDGDDDRSGSLQHLQQTATTAPTTVPRNSSPLQPEPPRQEDTATLPASTPTLTAAATAASVQQPQPHPLPTRSSLAQSSFAWMLEPADTATGSTDVAAAGAKSRASPTGRGTTTATTSSSSSSGTGTSNSTRKASFGPRSSPAGRSRHAFLFGEVVGGGGSGDPLNGGGGIRGGGPVGGHDGGGNSSSIMAGNSPDRRTRPITEDEIFGLEPLRRALPKSGGSGS